MIINKETLKLFRKDFKEAVKELEKDYGIEIELNKISYSENSFTGNIEVVNKIAGKSADQVKFEECCYRYHLKPTDYGSKFTYNHKDFILVGINTKAREYPIIGMGENGTRYKFPLRAVRELMDTHCKVSFI